MFDCYRPLAVLAVLAVLAIHTPSGRAEGEIGCSTANAPGSKGLSTIVILVLVAGAVLVVGGAIYFSSKSSKPAEDPSMQYQLEKG
jgi:hypothetical protein